MRHLNQIQKRSKLKKIYLLLKNFTKEFEQLSKQYICIIQIYQIISTLQINFLLLAKSTMHI